MKPTAPALFAFDLAWSALFCVVVGPPLVAAVWLFGRALEVLPWWLNVGLIPAYGIAILFGMTAMVALIRLPAPRLRPGTYRFPRHRIARSWLLHFALQRILYLPLWRPIIFSVATLRTAALRALGADVPMAFSSGSDPQLLDPALVRIGAGAVVGASVMTTCHFIIAGRLRLVPVEIGVDAQLHEAVKLGPGVRIGDGAIIGMETHIGPDCTVGRKARLGPACALLGNVEVGAGARLGAFVRCERGVVIGEKAIIAPGAVLVEGAVVAAGARYPADAPGPSDEPASGEA